MAIDDNTSYELTGAQVKDLAAKIKNGSNIDLLNNYVDITTSTITDLQGLTAAINAGKAFYWDDPMGDGSMPDGFFNASINNGTIEMTSMPDFVFTTAPDGALMNYSLTADATTGLFTGMTGNQLHLDGEYDQYNNVTFRPHMEQLAIDFGPSSYTYDGSTYTSIQLPLYSALGENEDGPMTQKAVREALYDDSNKTKVFIGRKQFSSDTVGTNSVGVGVSIKSSNTGTVAVGNWAEATGSYGVALGPDATASKPNGVAIGHYAKLGLNGASSDWSVALGAYASPTRSYEVNIGTGSQDGYGGSGDHTRVLGGVHAGINGTDAVNVDQLTTAIPGVFTGTDGTTAGTAGLVPAPATTDGDKYLKGDGTWDDVQIPPARTILYVNDGLDYITVPFYIYKDSSCTTPITWDEMFDLFHAENGGEVAIRVANSSDSVFCAVSFCHESESFGVIDASEEYGAAATYHINGYSSDSTRSKFEIHKQTLGGLVEMSYGEANAWQKFVDAYNSNSIVYCRASSNSNPATGVQGRKAFMAFVSFSGSTPTSVEFQYYRSVSAHTASQQGDQVFIYKLESTAGGTWSVTTREASSKVVAGTNMTSSYSNGTITLNATDTTYSNMTGASSSAAGAAGLVPAPAAGDQDKYLKGDGTWAVVQSGPTVVQTTGQSTTDVMSQKAVTDIIGNIETILQTLNSGNGAQ